MSGMRQIVALDTTIMHTLANTIPHCITAILATKKHIYPDEKSTAHRFSH